MNLSTLFRAPSPLFPPPHSTATSRSQSLSLSRSVCHTFQLGNSSNTESFERFLFLLWLWFSYGYLAFCIYRTNATDNIAIEGRNLNFSITTRQGKVVPILQDCSLRIPSGQFWMLLGPNGCGKSTLLKVYQVLPYHFFSFL
jgi:ABC-type molybdenum transport system ATPase subunit/photorepair protein PhrA